MNHFKKFFSISLSFILIILLNLWNSNLTANASDSISFIILSNYSINMDIKDEFFLVAFTSSGKQPTFKSSDSKIASVNTYGKITAKKAGTAYITAKIKNAEASCKVTVNKTKITLNTTKITMERGGTYTLKASVSNNGEVNWKSSKKSVATVNEKGVVTGIKPGETVITATVDGTEATCKVTIKSPTITLSKSKISLYRKQTAKLIANVSSGVTPVFKSNKKSVATVDAEGNITAIKHGSAIITATVDGVSKSCEVIVEQPTISLDTLTLDLKVGTTKTLKATVSSGNLPTWSSSNSSVATVDKNGKVTAIQKGRAYIYASEDGIKAKATVYVTE